MVRTNSNRLDMSALASGAASTYNHWCNNRCTEGRGDEKERRGEKREKTPKQSGGEDEREKRGEKSDHEAEAWRRRRSRVVEKTEKVAKQSGGEDEAEWWRRQKRWRSRVVEKTKQSEAKTAGEERGKRRRRRHHIPLVCYSIDNMDAKCESCGVTHV
ncbi:hypothetical protein NE237_002404 [Protea cynaroides]|uniref:Uncharacterized protein n=1 Tax=Protea cynaroides TaxID=273540 RepID=A0A9Q0KUZ6_9MAGN|nr:hypothetical protein NE237_002404 [Protea cynaroides]